MYHNISRSLAADTAQTATRVPVPGGPNNNTPFTASAATPERKGGINRIDGGMDKRVKYQDLSLS